MGDFMSKNMTILILLLIVMMMGAMGFIAMKVSGLNDLYVASKNAEQKQVIDSETVTIAIDGFKEELKTQKETLLEFSADLVGLKKDLKIVTAKEYMPAPQYVVGSPLFETEISGENSLNIVGDKSRVESWISNNELFLEYVMKKSLPLEYNRSRRYVEVINIISGSIFYQMGFRNNDGILAINGKVMNRGGRS